ncbi:hypothetical protein KK083_15350 [Fulvivirgaceae bacterium PWU4]|uniref:Uncharacterized protein n=1 Tax=Chryseosolibacter histidini TaxID=2782349 RepID=A0AAP2DKY7_9BACT|nr:hypothetical protein [Chryseosolibacter histidini]MBT1698266.1 hypothetical protein [Chryseosolibacter histidini]
MKPKKNSGNQDAAASPPHAGKKSKSAGQAVSGHPDSEGGSRQGNIGHQHNAEAGRGDRQT